MNAGSSTSFATAHLQPAGRGRLSRPLLILFRELRAQRQQCHDLRERGLPGAHGPLRAEGAASYQARRPRRRTQVSRFAVAGLSPARLLYEIMVPGGHLSLGAAMLISRAEGLAAAYAEIAQPAPAELARSVVVDAAALLEEVRSA